MTNDLLKYVGVAVVFVLLGALGIVIFTGIWMRVGLVAALVVIFGAFALVAWRMDQKAKRAREGLEDI